MYHMWLISTEEERKRKIPQLINVRQAKNKLHNYLERELRQTKRGALQPRTDPGFNGTIANGNNKSAWAQSAPDGWGGYIRVITATTACKMQRCWNSKRRKFLLNFKATAPLRKTFIYSFFFFTRVFHILNCKWNTSTAPLNHRNPVFCHLVAAPDMKGKDINM